MANKKNDVEFEKINPEEFEFVQRGEKIFDKKFETKPIGYFKDAMIRFSKNKTNVTASIILFTIILCSIFIPIFSSKNAETQESELAYLPPRIPLLEDWGIADGSKSLDYQVVDLETIGTVEGYEDLGIPEDFLAEYIYLDTLENYYSLCSDKDDDRCIGGTNVLTVDNTKEHAIIESGSYDDPMTEDVEENITTYQNLILKQSNESVLYIDIDSIQLTGDAVVNVYLKASFFTDTYTKVATITEAGITEIIPYDTLGTPVVSSTIALELVSTSPTDYVHFNSVEIYNNTQEEAAYSVSGFHMANAYTLASAIVTTENEATIEYTDPLTDSDPDNDDDDPEPIDETTGGVFSRSNGEVLVASFSYDAYGRAFGKFEISALPKSEFDAIMTEYADACVVTWTDPDDPDHVTYGEGCPVEEVLAKVGIVYIEENDEYYYSLNVYANYGLINGYEEIPYFIFGTSGAGKDLFKLIWIGTRTSLLLGLLVSAINISVGIVYGSISGYYGGTTDLLMQRFSEIVGRIPWLVTLSIFIAWYGPGQTALLGVLIISGWIGVAGVTRTQFYRYKGREYVLASRTLGAGDGRLIFRHILPNGIGTIITTSILSIPYVIFTESTLSFLGFGIGHGTTLHLFGFELSGVSIGVLLSDGRTRLLYEPYLTLWPAFIISILMITFNMFGNALRDAFNPALRGSE